MAEPRKPGATVRQIVKEDVGRVRAEVLAFLLEPERAQFIALLDRVEAAVMSEPCPPWCNTGPHPWMSQERGNGMFYRTHEYRLDGAAEETDPYRVVMTSLDEQTPTEGYVGEPDITVPGFQWFDMSPSTARTKADALARLAAQLHAAADKADEIAGGAR